MDKQKKLTIESLEKEQKKYNTIKKVELSNGDFLNIRPYLNKEDINNIISTYSSFLLDKDVKNNVKSNELLLFLQCFIILNNSDLLENSNIKTNVDKLKYCTLLTTNIVLFDEIMNSFDNLSLDLILKKFNEIIKIARNLEKQNARLQRKSALKKKK